MADKRYEAALKARAERIDHLQHYTTEAAGMVAELTESVRAAEAILATLRGDATPADEPTIDEATGASPCPFCAGTNLSINTGKYDDVAVECNDCSALGPPTNRSVERAYRYWNERKAIV